MTQEVVSSCTATIGQPATPVTWGAQIPVSVTSASCPGGATPLFQLFVKTNQGNGFVATGASSTTGSFSFDTSTSFAGTDQFYIGVKRNGTSETFAQSNIASVVVNDTVPPCTSTKLTSPANASSFQAGATINLTSTALGCPNPEFQYQFKLAGTQNYTVINSTFVTSPPGSSFSIPTAGSYNVTVVARNVGAHLGPQGFTARANANTITITPAPINHPPVANEDDETTAHHTAITFDPTANDTDADHDTLSLVGVGSASLGSVSVSGNNVTYTPSGTLGLDTFSYQVSDGHNAPVTGTIKVTVTDTAPVATGETKNTNPNQAVQIPVAEVCADADGDAVTLNLVSGASNGSASLDNAQTTLTYVANDAFNGTDSVVVSCSDGIDTSSNATITFNVVDRAPVGGDDVFATHNGASFAVTSNDQDPDGDSFFVDTVQGSPVSGTSTAGGSVSISGNNIQYAPPSNFSGSDSFVYTLSDGTLSSGSVTVTVNVGNAVPVGSDDAYSTGGATALVVNAASGVLANDSDADGDPISASLVTGAAHGTLTFNSDGSFTYVPSSSFDGTDTFSYVARDNHGGVSSAINVTISVSDQAPTANNDSFSGAANSTVTFSPGLLANDTDPNGDALSVRNVSALSNPAAGTLTVNANGTGTFVPTNGFVGSVTFTYQAFDGTDLSNTATVTISVSSASPGCTISISGPSTATFGVGSTYTATAACNTGAAEIEWAKKAPGGVNFMPLTGFSTANGSLVFTPSQLGTSSLEAIVRTHGTTTPTATSNVIAVLVNDTNPPCVGTIKLTSPASGTHVTQGSQVALTGLATCTSGGPPEYQFEFKLSTQTTYTPVNVTFTSTGAATWNVPSVAGTYNVTVFARTQGNHAPYELRANAINVIVQ